MLVLFTNNVGMFSELLCWYIITRMHIWHSMTQFFVSLCWRPFLPNKKSGCIWSTCLCMSGSDEFIAYTTYQQPLPQKLPQSHIFEYVCWFIAEQQTETFRSCCHVCWESFSWRPMDYLLVRDCGVRYDEGMHSLMLCPRHHYHRSRIHCAIGMQTAADSRTPWKLCAGDGACCESHRARYVHPKGSW